MKYNIATYNTKKTIAEALKNIMKTKPFSKITVTEIITTCSINRKTFYYHFQDIYDLLKWMFEEEAINIVKHFDLLNDYEEAIRFVMDYIDQNEYVISCAYDSIGRDEMKRFFYEDFVNTVSSVIETESKKLSVELEPDFKEYIAKFYCEALAGMLIDWIKNKKKGDREKTIQYLTMIIKQTINSLDFFIEQK